jgi:uncharacterized protein (TIGR03382 family)
VVVTASHCTNGSPASHIDFAVGASPTSYAATFGVDEILEHPWQDMALLVLDRDATEAVPELTPITGNTESVSDAEVGQPLDAAGYGDTYGTNPDGRWFARVYLAEVYSDSIVVDGRGDQGICYGDSGGPVLRENSFGDVVVVAVESWGDESCVDRDVMTRLDPVFDDFIGPVLGEQPAGDPCAGIDWLGRCDGDIVEWCENARLRSVDCASSSRACGWVDDDTGYFCIDTPPTEDPGPDVPTTDNPPVEPTPDPVTDTPVTDEPVDPTVSDEPVNQQANGKQQAIGCTQAGRSSSPSFLPLMLLGLLVLVRRR